ncbi:kynureninase [Streptomyces sp. NBC_00872]|uniref:kynureninase n=1 Tax=Streptomyces sp. NBC_00872 TaxID=2903686 RepID=UPI00386D6CA3|nr:kynureninase [Streptomyces sp. NBC_00872]
MSESAMHESAPAGSAPAEPAVSESTVTESAMSESLAAPAESSAAPAESAAAPAESSAVPAGPLVAETGSPAVRVRSLGARAAALDAADELAGRRELFALDDDSVYLDGNSLGALPRHVPERLQEVVGRQWGELRIRSWTESGWWEAPERIGDRIAPLVGAGPGRIVVGDSTSVNVFKAVVAAVRLAGPGRDEILVDATTFPTDGYMARSAARMTGSRIVPVAPAELPGALGPRTAVALVNHVDFRSGRLHDLPGITAAVHEAGALALWDLCHSAGALPVGLDEHGVDLAVGCTYKYLNGGPGAPAFLYVAERHQDRFDSPLPGWNSHADPFAMTGDFAAAEGAVRGRVGTPDILSMLALEAALDVWAGVTVEAVREKSLALTDFFLECVEAYAPPGRVASLTPAAHAERGSQVALRCAEAPLVMETLIARGIVGDLRRPDVLRFGFTPLYVGFADTERAARVLGEVLREVPAGPLA